jgi:signal transduction histidine kinase
MGMGYLVGDAAVTAPLAPPLADGPVVLAALADPQLESQITAALHGEARVICCAARDALDVAGQLEPDVIICDGAVAFADELALLVAIRSDSDLHTTPVLVLVTPDAPDALELLRAGANGYLALPLDPAALRIRTENLVAARAADARMYARRMAEERVRIARDLHDVAIQRLFAAGLEMNSLLPGIDAEDVRARLSDVVDELDAVITGLRTSIFNLQRPAGPGAGGFRAEVMAACEATGSLIGCAPRVAFDGPVDALVPDALADQALAVLRESLRNIAQHAQATRFEVIVSATPGQLSLTVSDNGVGPSAEPTAGNGLRNMMARAETLGGTCEFRTNRHGGSLMSWRIPLGG